MVDIINFSFTSRGSTQTCVLKQIVTILYAMQFLCQCVVALSQRFTYRLRP